MITTTQTDPVNAVRSHREVRRAHQTLQRALDGCAGDAARQALTQAVNAMHSDPTLALQAGGQRSIDLICALARQLKPLGRQAELARTRDRLLAAPGLPDTDRRRRIHRLGKINPLAISQEKECLERLQRQVSALAEQAHPEWCDPCHLAELARQMLPPEQALAEIAGSLRSAVAAAAALAPGEPEVRRLLDLAEQVQPDGAH